jgi:hypothetical protein
MKGPSKRWAESMSELGSRSGPMPMSTSPENTRAITSSTGTSTSFTEPPGCAAWKRAISPGHQGGGEQLRHRHPHHALLAAALVHHAVQQLVEVVQHRLQHRAQALAGIGQVHTARAAVDQAHAQGLLQSLTRPDRADCEMYRLSAARVKLWVRATARKARSWRRVTFIG